MADDVLVEGTPRQLLAAALQAGLQVRAEGDRLVVRGPRAAEALGRALLARKAEVMTALSGPEARLEAALRAHDWYYAFADDPDVHHRGEESERRLLELTRDCDAAVARALWQRYHPGPDTPASPCLWPGEGTPTSASAGWDTARAAAVVAEVDALVAAAVAAGGGANTPARRNVIEGDRAIVRRLAASHDPMLWNWPQSIPRLLARWRQDDETRQAADNAGRQFGQKESP